MFKTVRLVLELKISDVFIIRIVPKEFAALTCSERISRTHRHNSKR